MIFGSMTVGFRRSGDKSESQSTRSKGENTGEAFLDSFALPVVGQGVVYRSVRP